MEEKKGLKKNLGVATAMAIVVGCVIGSACFLSRRPSTQLQEGRRDSA